MFASGMLGSEQAKRLVQKCYSLQEVVHSHREEPEGADEEGGQW